jgi:hypothetical protein
MPLTPRQGGTRPPWYTAGMIAKRKPSNKKARHDHVTFERMPQPELDPATGLILESLRRREQPMTIR